jgi:hypothetical protein
MSLTTFERHIHRRARGWQSVAGVGVAQPGNAANAETTYGFNWLGLNEKCFEKASNINTVETIPATYVINRPLSRNVHCQFSHGVTYS